MAQTIEQMREQDERNRLIEQLRQVRATKADELTAIVQRVARAGGTPLVVAEGRRALGVIHLKDIVKGGIRDRFAHLRAMGITSSRAAADARAARQGTR